MKSKDIRNKTFIYLICIFLALLVFIPLALVLLTSLKSGPESSIIDFSLPEKFLFSNYKHVIEEGNIGRAFKNSLILTVLSVTGITFISSLTAFVLVRRDSFLSRLANRYFLLGLVAPIALIPAVIIVKLLGINNTIFAPLFIYIAIRLPLTIMLFTGFIQGIPKEIDEAAMMDGCSPLKLFFSVIFPLLKPVIFTSIIINFMAIWNDFQIALYFIPDSELQTLPLSMYNFVGFMTYNWNYISGFIIISIIPILVVYLFGQKYIIDGMVSGAVK